MIPASVLAQLCVDLYDDSKRSSFDHFWDAEDVVVAHKKVGKQDVIIFRGSIDALDWLRDIEAFPVFDKELGFTHGGFQLHMDAVMDEVRPVLGDDVVVTGHSLGAARARVFAGVCIVRKVPVTQVTVFGSPKPAFANLRRLLEKSGIIHTSYRNRNDPVPLVPGVLPWWEHTDVWVKLNEHPEKEDDSPLRDHHIELYLRGVKKLEGN